MSWYIDDLYTFVVHTHTPSTGARTDADSNPAYRVYEDETGTAILTGTMAKLDDANTLGQYSEQFALSAANGFEVLKTYNIEITGVVGGVTGATERQFKIDARIPTLTEFNDGIDDVQDDIFNLNDPSTSDIATAVWAAGTRTLTSFGTLIADIWAAATRTLTAGTNIVLAKGVGLTGLNDISQANAQTAAAAALTAYPVPTLTELQTESGNIQTAIGNLNDLSQAQAQAAVAAALTAYPVPTFSQLQTEINSVQTDIGNLAIPTAAAIAVAVRQSQLTATAPAVGVAPTTEQALFALLQLLTNRRVVGTNLEILGLDGTTVIMTLTLDAAPPATTSQVRAS